MSMWIKMQIKGDLQMNVTFSSFPVRRLYILTFVVLLLTVGGIVSADTAAAQSAERDGDLLVISDLNQSAEVVEIDLENHELEWRPKFQNGGEATFPVPNRSQIGDKSLINESIQITQYDDYENGSVVEKAHERLDLHTITFSSQSPIWIDSNDNIRLPLNKGETAGISDGDSINLTGAQGEVVNKENQIKVSRSDVEASFEDMDSVQINAFATNGIGSVAENPIRINPQVRDNGNNRILWHPLISQGTELDIQLQDANEITSTAETHGKVSLSGATESEISILRVTDSSGETLLNRSNQDGVEFQGHPKITAGRIEGNGNLMFDRAIVDYPIKKSAFIIESGEEVTFETNTIRRSESISTEAQLTQNNSILVQSSSGVLEIQIESVDSGSNGGLLGIVGTVIIFVGLLSTPVLIGGVSGVAYPKTVNSAGKKFDYVLNLFFVLSLSVAIFFVLDKFTQITLVEVEIPPLISQIAAIFGILLAPVVTILLQKRFSGNKSENTQAATKTAQSNTFDATVTVKGLNSYSDGVKIELTPNNNDFFAEKIENKQYENTETYTGLMKDVSYDVNVKGIRGSKIKSGRAKITDSDREASVEIEVPTQISVVNPETEPIPDVQISSSDFLTGSTDTTGNISASTRPRNDQINCTLSHPKYQNKSVTISTGGKNQFELEPKRGDIEITAKIDQEPSSKIPIQMTPVPESDTVNRSSDSLVSTGERNVLSDIAIGDYTIESNIKQPHFENDSTTVTVKHGRTEQCHLDIRFTWDLDSVHRNRINDLRDRINDFSQQRGQDTVIHGYYGTVIEEFLLAVESIPNKGILFIESNIHPEEVADQLLTTADRILDIFEESLSTKRNVDLFAACSDMPQQNVRWNGEVKISEAIDRLESNSSDSRREAQERYTEIEEGVIKQYKKELTEIEPISEVHKRSLELINNTNNNNDLSISAYGNLIVLRAVEQAFEHSAIKNRLSKTVF